MLVSFRYRIDDQRARRLQIVSTGQYAVEKYFKPVLWFDSSRGYSGNMPTARGGVRSAAASLFLGANHRSESSVRILTCQSNHIIIT